VSVLLALLAQLLHIALILAAAPTVAGLLDWAEAGLAHRACPPPLQRWRELSRLLRKQVALAENASPWFRAAPPASLASAFLAACLVPTFTQGMAFAGLGDLLVLAGLLVLPGAVLSLAALDAGTASSAVAVARCASLACLAEPAMFLAILALGLLGGTTNVDLLIGLQREAMLQPYAASALAAAGMAAVALGSARRHDLLTEFSAIDLALLSLADTLWLLTWLDLIAALFLPLGMGSAGGGPAGWVLGLAAWIVKLAVLASCLAILRHATGVNRRRGMSQILIVASVLGLLAVAIVIAGASAA